MRPNPFFVTAWNLVTVLALASVPTPAAAQGGIVAFVNNDVINQYQLEGRTTLLLKSTTEMGVRINLELKRRGSGDAFKEFAFKRLQAVPPKSKKDEKDRIEALKKEFVASVGRQVEKELRPKIRKEALAELVDELLMMGEAKRLKVEATRDQVEKAIAQMDNRNKGANKKILDGLGDEKTPVLASRYNHVLAQLSWDNVLKSRGGQKMSKAKREELSASTLKNLKDDAKIEYR